MEQLQESDAGPTGDRMRWIEKRLDTGLARLHAEKIGYRGRKGNAGSDQEQDVLPLERGP